MTFTYPAVFMPHKNDKGYHVTFPDLQCCEADGPDLEDAVELKSNTGMIILPNIERESHNTAVPYTLS